MSGRTVFDFKMRVDLLGKMAILMTIANNSDESTPQQIDWKASGRRARMSALWQMSSLLRVSIDQPEHAVCLQTSLVVEWAVLSELTTTPTIQQLLLKRHSAMLDCWRQGQ